MGTSMGNPAEEAPAAPAVDTSKKFEGPDEVKEKIHQHAKEVISSFPQKVFLLRSLCNLHSFYQRHHRRTCLAEYIEAFPPEAPV